MLFACESICEMREALICPHCLKKIDDGESFCPYCHGYVGKASNDEFVFCEGCGARLSIHDRTCPKCGRPAPGILSTDSAASDLAAGKTASFPRLTKSLIESDAPRVEPASAARAIDDSVDPSSTNVLSREELDDPRAKKCKRRQPVDEDPYHPHRRSYGKLIAVLVTLAIIGGGAAFVVYDPLGVMPGFYESFRAAAREAFPSRQLGETPTGSATVQDPATAEGEAAEEEEPQPMTDAQVFDAITIAYRQLDSYNGEEAIGEVIDTFNSYYLEPDLSVRQQRSQSAYSLRDSIQQTIDDLEAIQAPADTVYAEDIEHVHQLAEWMYGRVDQICASWDVSLAIPEGESTLAHEDEILQPMRDAGSDDLYNYDAYYYQWEPVRKDSAE